MAELLRSGPGLLDRRLMRVEVERTIDAPVAAIWELISDHRNRSAWYPACDEFTATGPIDQGVGATFDEREWAWKATSEIVVWDDGRRIGFTTLTLNFPGLLRKLYTEFELAPKGEAQTTVHIRGAFQFGWLGWLLCAYTYPQMVGSMWFDYTRSLRALTRMASDL